MRVSGFSFVRDAVRLHYPVAEAIRSVLPIVDEFVIAVGRGQDGTAERIRAIGDPKVRLLESDWDPALFVHGAINAQQSNLALDACTGDWAIYVQADEVIHEEDHPRIVRAMEQSHEDPRIEGLLFDYLHFWGDFDHVHWTRNWYRHEVRVVRRLPGMRSWKSAQGFRIDGRKPVVRQSGARVFHYGWVRPPETMKRKQMALDRLHHPEDWVQKRHPEPESAFDYGPLENLRRFEGTHPAVMREWIADKSWRAETYRRSGTQHEHNRRSVRFLTWCEDHLLHHRIGGYRNYVLVD
jgi:glycosyltransferase involved in cell wall biosynthesis